MIETLCMLGIRRLEIYDSKTVISTLQISALLDYWKDCFRKIFKGIKINKSCFVFLVTLFRVWCFIRSLPYSS